MKSSADEIVAELYKLLKLGENQLKEITLNDTENKIFSLLLAVSNKLPQHPILRVAGGWVRDKLLGRDNKDIDVAIDNMSGAEFANAVVDYMRSIGEATKNVGVIKSNPEQSKHLETATTFIYGLPIDFVNLRTETYADSRIPEMKAGTPQEDAFRRDLTINSLFFNINTSKVEDFTGKGVEDLKNGIIRTPLEPLQTFTDDPLRALRAIRFASRYGFALDPKLIEAAKSPDVKEALRNKISRERIAEELRGMLKGPNPAMALELAKELDLRDELFPRPEGLREWDMDQNNPHHELNLYDHLVKVVRSMNALLKKPGHEVSADERIVLLLGAFFHDMGKFEPSIHGLKQLGDMIVSTYHGHEPHSKRIAEHVMKELKMSNDEVESVLRLIEPAGNIENMVRAMEKGQSPTRKALSRLVQTLGDAWKHAVYLAMADEASKKKGGPELDESEIGGHYELIDMIEKDKAVANAHKIKPLLNGNEIAGLMGMKPGPALGVISRALADWHLSNLEATKQEAIDFVKKEFGGKTEEELTTLAPMKKKKSTREERLKKLAGLMETIARVQNGYLAVDVPRPNLGEEEILLPPNLKNRGEWHITIIRPPEMKVLKKLGKPLNNGDAIAISGSPVYKGLGKVSDGENEAYFVVIDWPEAQKFRAQYGLPSLDFHITMGFSNKDIHDVPKNRTLKEEK